MSTYVVFFHNEKGPWRVRIVSKGFACTRNELAQELKTYCKARGLYKVETYSNIEAAKAPVTHCLEGKWVQEFG